MRVPYWYVKNEMLDQEQYKEYCSRVFNKGEDPDTVLKDIKDRRDEAAKDMFKWFMIILVVALVIGAAMA